MAARREQIESQTTVVLELPGYEGILGVEFRALGWQRIRQSMARHRKIKDEGLKEMYAAADTLIAAREETYELNPEVSTTTVEIDEQEVPARPLGETFKDLSIRAGLRVTESTTERQAVFGLLHRDARLMDLYRAWEEWLKGVDFDEELAEDFGRTG
jgi:hypothetical protein